MRIYSFFCCCNTFYSGLNSTVELYNDSITMVFMVAFLFQSDALIFGWQLSSVSNLILSNYRLMGPSVTYSYWKLDVPSIPSNVSCHQMKASLWLLTNEPTFTVVWIIHFNFNHSHKKWVHQFKVSILSNNVFAIRYTRTVVHFFSYLFRCQSVINDAFHHRTLAPLSAVININSHTTLYYCTHILVDETDDGNNTASQNMPLKWSKEDGGREPGSMAQ